jgi:CBS-domain-containing membrane protein
MSQRAAWRLEDLGFPDVYDYEAGKLDWLAFGLPVEGRAAAEPTVGPLADPDAPTCRPDERLRELEPRLASGPSWCAVVNDSGVVVGRVRRRQLAERPEAAARDVMEPGPSTYRPSLPAAELVSSMRERGFEKAFVTSSDGRWMGLVTRGDLERAISRAADAVPAGTHGPRDAP